jgi:molybdopterin/thiamine biosynthesis adenylyltransferase
MKYTKQIGIFNPKEFKDNTILIVGCGAVGSFTAVGLAKLGIMKFRLIDPDKIEEHNVLNQFFGIKDTQRYKTDVVKGIILDFNDQANVYSGTYKFASNEVEGTQIVLSCVDSMDVRKEIFNACKNGKVQLFIDARMSGLQGQVYSVDMTKKKEISNYEKSLFTQKEAVQERCTANRVVYPVMGIASIICNQIVKAFKGEKINNYIVIDYNVPQMF